MKIYCKWHPFQQRPVAVEFSAWRSYGALSRTVAPAYPHHRIYRNDALLTPEDYDQILREEDTVLVCGMPSDPVSLTAILTSLAVSVALTAATIGLTLLLRPKTKKLSGPEAQRNSITGVGNQVDPFGPIPTVVGKIRLFPRFPGKFPTQYTEVVGKDQYLRFLLLVGKGPMTIPRDSIKIVDTEIDKFQHLELEILEGKAGDPPLTLYTTSVSEAALAVVLTNAASWQTQTTGVDCDQISFDWAFLTGLQKSTKNGGLDAVTVDIQIEYREVGSVGEWSGFGLTQALNHTLISRDGDLLPGPITLRSNGADTRTVTVYGEHPIGTAVSEAIVLTSTTEVTGAVTFSKITSATLSALDSDRVVTMLFDDTYGEPIRLVPFATLGSFFRTVGKTRTVVRQNHTWTVPNGQYDVRARRLTADSNDLRILDECTWTALRTITNTPPVTEPNVALIAGRIKATDQLNGQIDNLSCVPEAEWPTYDGADWTAPVVTRNNAWAAAGVLTGANNKRPVPVSQLDADSFKAAADWCTSKGFEYNGVFDTDGNVEDVVQTILAAARCSLDNVDGLYVIVIDQQQTDIMNHFTPRNTWDFEGHAEYPEEVHALRVGFLNEDLEYAEDERLVLNDGYTEETATKIDFVEYEGVTNADQVWKLGRYELADQLLQFERFSFTTDFESKRCTRGDLVLVSHDAMLVGIGWGLTTKHEYAPTGGRAITIDSTVILDPAKTYGVQIRKTSTGETLQAQIVNTGNETSRLEFVDPLPGLDTTLGNLVTVGEWGEISQRCIVKRIENTEDNGYLAARITCAVEAPGRYTADETEIPPHTPIITLTAHPLNLRPPTPTIRTIRSSEDVSVIQDNGAYGVRMAVLVHLPASLNPEAVMIQAQYRLFIDPDFPNPHPWISTPMEEGQNGEIVIENVDVTLIYEVRVRTLNKLNLSLISPWSAISTHEVLGDTIPPAPPSSATATAGDRMVTLSWTNPKNEDETDDEIDFAAVEVWRSEVDDITSDPSTAVYLGETSGESYPDGGLTNGTEYFYGLRSRDWAGNPSAFIALLGVTPTPNVVISTAEVLLASKNLSTLENITSMNYTTKGGRVTTRGKLWIDAATNDPASVEFADITLMRASTNLDNYTLSFQRLGPGYPGEINLFHEEVTAIGTYTYALLYAGSTAVARAIKISINIEEVEV